MGTRNGTADIICCSRRRHLFLRGETPPRSRVVIRFWLPENFFSINRYIYFFQPEFVPKATHLWVNEQGISYSKIVYQFAVQDQTGVKSSKFTKRVKYWLFLGTRFLFSAKISQLSVEKAQPTARASKLQRVGQTKALIST